MSISVVQDVLDNMWIKYTKTNSVIKVQSIKYFYIIAYDEDESRYDIHAYDLDENKSSALDFNMKLYPNHFMHRKTYFEKWFKGVQGVITHYYMEKS